MNLPHEHTISPGGNFSFTFCLLLIALAAFDQPMEMTESVQEMDSAEIKLTLPATDTSVDIATDLHTLTFESLGIPASYRDIPSHWGLWDLQLWHDRIYLAHGDWIVNTGPVRMIYFDVKSERFIHDEEFVADEEAIERFRVFDDLLIAPGSDSMGEWDYGNFYSKALGEPWVKHATIPGAIHAWDIARFEGAFIATGRIAFGDASYGTLWVSRDEGNSWESHPDFQNRGYSEATSLFVLQDHAYATMVGRGSSPTMARLGNKWTASLRISSRAFRTSTRM
jgi:hypothetical protein